MPQTITVPLDQLSMTPPVPASGPITVPLSALSEPTFRSNNELDAQGVPLNAPRDIRGQIITSAEEHEPTVLEQMAHPQTLVDFARILMLPVDTVKAAITRAVAARVGPPLVGQGLSATGRGLEAVANSRAAQAAEAGGMAEAAWNLDKKGAMVAVVPTVLRYAGRGLQRAGAALTPAVAEAAPAAAASAAAPTEFQAAQAARQAANALPDQKALNEAALAARRAAYAASQKGAAAEPIVAASGKMQLTAPEMKEFTRLVNRGMKLPDALAEVRAMRELAKRLGGASPAEVAKAVAHRESTGRW